MRIPRPLRLPSRDVVRGGPKLTGAARRPRQLMELLPDSATLRASMRFLDVTGLAVAAGDSAWFGLGSVDIERDVREELAIASISCTRLPLDSAGAGTSVPLAERGGLAVVPWGDAFGQGAAIVVGVGLPVKHGAWTTSRCELGVIEPDWSRPSSVGLDRFVKTFAFPAGKINDANPEKLEETYQLGAAMKPLPFGARLDIALVVRGETVSGKVGAICGLADVEVHCARLDRPVEYGR